QDESDEAHGEDRPPRLRVPPGHRVPREEAEESEDRNDRDPARGRELRGRRRLEEPLEDSVELEGAEREGDREEEENPGHARHPTAADPVLRGRALVLKVEDRVRPLLEEG